MRAQIAIELDILPHVGAFEVVHVFELFKVENYRREEFFCRRWQGPWGGAIDLGSGSAGLLAGELVGLLFVAN